MSEKSKAKQKVTQNHKGSGDNVAGNKTPGQTTIAIKDCSDQQIKSFLWDLSQEKNRIDSSIATLEDELRRRRTPVAPQVVAPVAEKKVEEKPTTEKPMKNPKAKEK